jgi:hypothetical protein
MKGWALTSVACEPPDRYHDEVTPITWPLMEQYAKNHEMDWCPKIISRAEYNDFAGKGTAPHGTAAVYASLPHRRQLLSDYEGVVFFDCDTVVATEAPDICLAVSAKQPICTEPACNCATMVLKKDTETLRLLAFIWSQRSRYCHYQWLEQAAYMDLMGFDGKYPGDFKPPVWLGPTAWTPLRADLPAGWNAHPLHPLPNPLYSLHPGGIQPFEARMVYVREFAAGAQNAATLTRTPIGERT